ncbi:hypothetical protein [Treponema pedis]|uniref:Leucine-rich repeat domain-containing protein n=1 Tax=Treponema pedis TaxID=409322 RepID=A0A7S6WN42_9SPIR|nr:hypothetical protein [Treponema pedis]QOW60195.1 hypothetical protein IFE08_10170 [Treponema pedis]
MSGILGTSKTTNVMIRDFNNSITEKDILELLKEDDIKLIRPYGGYTPGKQDLYLLNGFFKLRPEVEFRVTAAGMLKLLPDVQAVSEVVEGCFGENLEDLKYLKCVQSLRLVEKDITPLISYRDTLKKLTLEGGLKKDADNVLANMFYLNTLNLESTTLKSFERITKLPLQNLYIYGNKPSEPIPIKELSELKNIRIKNNSSWNDFGFLSNLKKLESIRIEYCSKIEKVPPIDGLHNLKYVEFSNCNRLKDITALWNLSNDCEVLATGTQLSKEKITYCYEPELGLQAWCKEHSTNLPPKISEK